MLWTNTCKMCNLKLKINSVTNWTCSKCLMSELPFHTVRNMVVDTQPDFNHFPPIDECVHRSALTSNSSHLSLMRLNAQSMTSTFDELVMLLNDYPFDVVMLSETWLKDNALLLQHVSIPGFVATYRNRQQHKGGVE